jgi:micrococcal nuclease
VPRSLLILVVVAVAVLGGRVSIDAIDGLGESDGSTSRSAPVGAVLSARVSRVVDGDTLHVRTDDGDDETVRVLGIDTPEVHRPDTPVECGARAASAAMRRRALSGSGRGRAVRLVTDPSQDRRDRYGRLLAYVERADTGADLGRGQVRDGWAEVYVFEHHPFRRVKAYRRAARVARAAGAGVYGRCGGDFHRPQ